MVDFSKLPRAPQRAAAPARSAPAARPQQRQAAPPPPPPEEDDYQGDDAPAPPARATAMDRSRRQAAPQNRQGFAANSGMRPAQPRQQGNTRGPQPPQRAMVVDESFFEGIQNARAGSRDGDYLKVGHYLVRIDRCKQGMNRKRIMFTAIEGTVIAVMHDGNGEGHRVGDEVTHYMGSDSDYYFDDLSGFICAATGSQPTEVEPSDCKRMVSDEQPFAGFIMEYRGKNQPTQSGGVWTKIRWKKRWDPEEAVPFMTEDAVERYLGVEQVEETPPPPPARRSQAPIGNPRRAAPPPPPEDDYNPETEAPQDDDIPF